MKIIDLYVMLSKGEQPKKFKYRDEWYAYSIDDYDFRTLKQEYRNADVPTYQYLMEIIDASNLNDEVEIIEEKPRDIEVCGTWFTKIEYDKLAHSEEEKKIPEKLNISNFPRHNNSLKKTAIKVNEIIDYLESQV